FKASYWREQRAISILSIEWLAQIEQDARAIACQFDAGSTNLMSAPMNACLERPSHFWFGNLFTVSSCDHHAPLFSTISQPALCPSRRRAQFPRWPDVDVLRRF